MGTNTVIAHKKEQRPFSPEQDSVAIRPDKNSGHFLRTVGLIIGREYKNHVTQRSFIISTTIMLVLVVIGACVPTAIRYFTSSTAPAQTKMAVVNNAGAIAGLNGEALTQYIETKLNEGVTGTETPGQPSSEQPFIVTLESATAVADLQKQVKDGTFNMLLVIDRSTSGDLRFTQYTNTSSGSSTTPQLEAAPVQLNFLDRASRLDLTPEQTRSLSAQPEVNVISAQQESESRSISEQVAGYVVAYAGIILVSLSVFLYGNMVAQGVAEEKGGRIMEILINAATPFQLMVGKILGIGAAGLTQMVCLVGVGIGALFLQIPLSAALFGSESGGLPFNIAGVSLTPLLLLLLYFLLGFLLYATLFAAVGALVRRQDEAQNAATPLTMLFMVGYLVSYAAIYIADAPWVKVMSHIPFWTPALMLVRVGMGTVAWWEIVLSVVLMTATIFICTLIAARIYRFGVLMYGQKPGLRQLVKVLRS